MKLSLLEPLTWMKWGWMVESCATRHGVAVSAILGRGRTHSVRFARRDLYTCLWGSGLAYAEIGRMLGRDHQTVRSGVLGELAS